MFLKEAETSSKVRVKNVLAKGELRRRFLDLGIIEGTNIEVLYRGALGDPTAYFIRGAKPFAGEAVPSEKQGWGALCLADSIPK